MPFPCRQLLFFQNSMLRYRGIKVLWESLFSPSLFHGHFSFFLSIVGLENHGKAAMPRVEEFLASYLSPTSPVWRASALPSRAISALVGKAYIAAGQASAALHTMALLQAYLADLLKELLRVLNPDQVSKLHRAMDLVLCATKQKAHAIGYSVAVLVAVPFSWNWDTYLTWCRFSVSHCRFSVSNSRFQVSHCRFSLSQLILFEHIPGSLDDNIV